MMKKFSQIIIFFFVIVLIIVLVFVVKLKERNFSKNIEGKVIYFYGKTCPHCANVEMFFEENNVKDKIQFEEKEVYTNITNAKLLIFVAKEKCGLKENEIGVPLFWDGKNGKCVVGDQPIIDYFKEKLLTKHE